MSAAAAALLGVVMALGAGPPFLDDLDAARAEAGRSGSPIFVQFSAAWCEPCKEMKEHVFPHPQVARRLERFVRVVVDVETEAGEEAWMQYKLPGLPVLSFLRSDGEEVRDLRITGMPDLPDFVARLDKALDVLGALTQAEVASSAGGAAPARRKGLPWWWIAIGGAVTLLAIGTLAWRSR